MRISRSPNPHVIAYLILVPLIFVFFKSMACKGTTTVECKTGYGSNWGTESKVLRILTRLKRELPLDISITYFAASSLPQYVHTTLSDQFGYPQAHNDLDEVWLSSHPDSSWRNFTVRTLWITIPPIHDCKALN